VRSVRASGLVLIAAVCGSVVAACATAQVASFNAVADLRDATGKLVATASFSDPMSGDDGQQGQLEIALHEAPDQVLVALAFPALGALLIGAGVVLRRAPSHLSRRDWPDSLTPDRWFPERWPLSADRWPPER